MHPKIRENLRGISVILLRVRELLKKKLLTNRHRVISATFSIYTACPHSTNRTLSAGIWIIYLLIFPKLDKKQDGGKLLLSTFYLSFNFKKGEIRCFCASAWEPTFLPPFPIKPPHFFKSHCLSWSGSHCSLSPALRRAPDRWPTQGSRFFVFQP